MSMAVRKKLVLCRFLKIMNRESRFILPFFWPTIPESIPEKGQKQSRNRNCDSFGIGIDTALIRMTLLGDADVPDSGVVVEGEGPEALHLREPDAPRLHAVQGLLVDLQ